MSAWTGFDQDFADAGQPAEYPAGSQEAEPYTFLREDPQPDGSILVTERRQVGGTIYRHRIPARPPANRPKKPGDGSVSVSR